MVLQLTYRTLQYDVPQNSWILECIQKVEKGAPTYEAIANATVLHKLMNFISAKLNFHSTIANKIEKYPGLNRWKA